MTYRWMFRAWAVAIALTVYNLVRDWIWPFAPYDGPKRWWKR